MVVVVHTYFFGEEDACGMCAQGDEKVARVIKRDRFFIRLKPGKRLLGVMMRVFRRVDSFKSFLFFLYVFSYLQKKCQ